MSLGDAQAKLRRAAKDLDLRWGRAREGWRDARAREVEETVMAEVRRASKAATDAMQRLDEAVRRARRDCGDG